MADVVRSYTHAQDHDGSWDYEYPYDGDTQTHGLMYEDTTTGEWKDISSDLPYDVFYDDGYASTYYIYSANGAWVEHINTSILFTSADYVSGPDITFSHPNLAPGDTTNKLTINGREVDIQVGDCILLYNESGDDHSSIYPNNILHNFIVSKTYDDYYEYYSIITTAWYIEPGVWSNTSGANDPTHRIVLANCAGDENGNHGHLDPFYDTPYQRVVHWFEIEPADLSADDTRNQITVNGQTINAQYGNYISFIYGTEYYTTNITDTIEERFPQSPGLMTYIYPGIWADCDSNPLNVAEYSYIYHESVKGHVQLKWTDPQDLPDWDPYPCTWEGTVIVRKEDSPPLHRWDGEKVVRTTTRDKYKTEPYKDEDIVSGKTYYYAFMPYYTRYDDPDHPIRYYTFTKVIKVEIGDKSLSSTINSIDVDGTNATINYTLSQPDGGSFTSIKMYGKIGKNPKCDNTDDVVEDVDSSVTSLTLTGLESGSTYYFCLVTMDTNNKKLSSNVMSCYPFDPVPANIKPYISTMNDIAAYKFAWANIPEWYYARLTCHYQHPATNYSYSCQVYSSSLLDTFSSNFGDSGKRTSDIRTYNILTLNVTKNSGTNYTGRIDFPAGSTSGIYNIYNPKNANASWMSVGVSSVESGAINFWNYGNTGDGDTRVSYVSYSGTLEQVFAWFADRFRNIDIFVDGVQFAKSHYDD